MRYARLHGCQNAYIYVSASDLGPADPAETARQVSAPPERGGIGADGLIVYSPDDKADVRMVMYNADGSRAAMCGNGIRGLAKWILDNDAAAGRVLAAVGDLKSALAARAEFEASFRALLPEGVTGRAAAVRVLTVATDSGVRTITALLLAGRMRVAATDMGVASLRLDKSHPACPKTDKDRLVDEPLTIRGETCRITCVGVGNLHAVAFVPDATRVDLLSVGAAIERHPLFPDRINVHFVTVHAPDHLIMRPWERGSGATQACGTGACAALAAAVARRGANLHARIEQPGGEVWVQLEPLDTDRWQACLIGPAELTETGDWRRREPRRHEAGD